MPPEFALHEISLDPSHVPVVSLGVPFRIRIRARRPPAAGAVTADVPITCSPDAFSVEPRLASISFDAGQVDFDGPVDVTLTGPAETLLVTVTVTYDGVRRSVVVQPRVNP